MISFEYYNYPFRFKHNMIIQIKEHALDEIVLDFPYYKTPFPTIIMITDKHLTDPGIINHYYKL